jgi:hypothetical protein
MLFPVSNVVGAELDLGRMEDALAHAQAAIARLHELGADAGAGHLYGGAMSALIALGRLDEALAAGRAAYPRLLQEGDEYRLLVPLAVVAAARGRVEAAAQISGFNQAVNARPGAGERMRTRNLNAQLNRLLADGLSAEDSARLHAEGAAMRAPDVFRLAFAAA